MVEINSMQQLDYLKKYSIFQSALIVWIVFIPLKNTLYELSVLGMNLMFIYHVITFKTYEAVASIFKQTRALFIGFILIILSMFISSPFGLNFLANSLDLVKFFYRYVMLVFVLFYFYSFGFFTRKMVLTTIVCSLTIYSLDGLYQYFAQYDLLFHKPKEGGGLTGPIFSRNVFGLFMSVYASIVLYLLLQHKNKASSYVLYLTLSGLFFIALFNLSYSFSRSAWLAFIVFIVLYCLINIKKILFSKQQLLIFIILILGVFAIFVTNHNLMHRFYQLLQGYDANRFVIWREALNFIKESIWVGYGVESSVILMKNSAANRIHNMFLEIAFYLGVLGLISYIYLIGTIYKTIYITRQFHYIAFLTAYFVILQFEGSLVNSKISLSLFILYVWFIFSHLFERNETIPLYNKADSK